MLNYDKVRDFIKKFNTKYLLFFVLLIAIVLISVNVRLSNTDVLIDSTTGNYIPTAVDPYYFMRTTEHFRDGGLPIDHDNMRYMNHTKYTTELMPILTYRLYVFTNYFIDIDFYYFLIISPVLYFALAIIFFYLFMEKLTSNRYASLISTACLAFTPLLLYRTSTGFYDHEAIGTMFLFMTLYYMTYFFDSNNTPLDKFGKYFLFPFCIFMTIYAWGGIARIFLIIYPATFFFLNMRDSIYVNKIKENINEYHYLEEFTITFAVLNMFLYIYSLTPLGMNYNMIISVYFLSLMGLPCLGMVAYYLISLFVAYIDNKNNFKILQKYQKWFISLIITLIAGLIFIIFTGEIKGIINKLLYPIMVGRVGLTVAENRGVSLLDIHTYVGTYFTIIYLIAAIMILYPIISRLIEYIRKKENNFHLITDVEYFMIILFFIGTYLLNSFIRMMYINSIFLSIFTGFVIAKIFNIYYHKTDDSLLKMLSSIMLILIISMSLFNIYVFHSQIENDVKGLGPSFNTDWQNAMHWVRTNTDENSLFLHWWDYGYWIQTMGERRTLTDGGHYTSFWDHTMARYVLTTPNDISAYQYFNTFNITHLLIDGSDIGKYSAFSSIANHKDHDDRISYIGQFLKNEAMTSENRNGTTYVYNGQLILDEEYAGTTYLKAFSSAIVQLRLTINNNSITELIGLVTDNRGIPVYIKIRYVYINGQLYDLGEGYEGAVRFVASYNVVNNVPLIDNIGGALAVTPRVYEGFFAQTYIFDNYEYLELQYEQPKYTEDKFLYAGNRLIAPISIYKVKDNGYGTNEGFLKLRGNFSEFDDNYDVNSYHWWSDNNSYDWWYNDGEGQKSEDL